MARAARIADNGAMTADLFPDEPAPEARDESVADGAMLLRGFARANAPALLQALEDVQRRAPFRFMVTPGGYRMSVAMTNCGVVGWITDRTGYRYGPIDPLTGENWPAMPEVFAALATQAAARAGFAAFAPDACLINRYEPGSRLSLHQDKDERDLAAPVVSVSLGLPAVFLFGGARRADRPQRLPLAHGDVVVWGGPARLFYHGLAPVSDAEDGLTGRYRVNLTFRKAL
jgi:alkylated DNA repair protein (DNA oxidative demethylase)